MSSAANISQRNRKLNDSKMKLRDTLSQSIHFVPTKIEVPKKQTAFYDHHHGSDITAQKTDQWRQRKKE